MSGGSLGYLSYKEPCELFNYISEIEEVEAFLLNRGELDIAKDVRRLIEYLRSAENRIGVLKDRLEDVFHAVEWYMSGDTGEDSLNRELNLYRDKE